MVSGVCHYTTMNFEFSKTIRALFIAIAKLLERLMIRSMGLPALCPKTRQAMRRSRRVS